MLLHRRLWVKRDKLNRPKFVGSEINKLILKSLYNNSFNINKYKKIYFSYCLNYFQKQYSISYYRRHCHRHGTGRSVFKLFKYSRHEAKRLSSYGYVMGMRKSSF